MRLLTLMFVAFFALNTWAFPPAPVKSYAMLSAATATGYSAVMPNRDPQATFQAYGATSAGAGAATIIIQVSNLPAPNESTDVDWITLGTITLTLSTTRSSDGFAKNAPWRHIRAKLSAISGTNAAVTVYAGG
jgi:hypothetical protein